MVGLLLCSILSMEAEDKIKSPSAKDDLDALQGTWTILQYEQKGIDLTRYDKKKGLRLGEIKIEKDKFFLLDMDKPGKLQVDVTTTPRRFEVTFSKENKAIGIYKIDGDAFYFCWTDPESGYPERFTTKKEDTNEAISFVLKRKPVEPKK